LKVKSKNINSDTHFRILVAISENPDITQRELAKELGVSLGRINYCIKALVEIGYIKLINFKNNPNKINYLYVLTPRGISQKTLLIKDFLKRKIAEYELLEKEIHLIKSSIGKDLI
jgi:EPS-associated MarR family transcriptional regulator